MWLRFLSFAIARSCIVSRWRKSGSGSFTPSSRFTFLVYAPQFCFHDVQCAFSNTHHGTYPLPLLYTMHLNCRGPCLNLLTNAMIEITDVEVDWAVCRRLAHLAQDSVKPRGGKFAITLYALLQI